MNLTHLRELSPSRVIKIAEDVWSQKDAFICWPKRALLFIPGRVRTNYHVYTAEQKQRLRAAEIRPDSRSNGPAIMSYLLSGGVRPKRVSPGRDWSIHHIYDGKYPWPGRTMTTHAVKDGRYFTEAAGLVAVHPVADALADEVPYFTWLLRREAFLLFGFNPDNILFNSSEDGIGSCRGS